MEKETSPNKENFSIGQTVVKDGCFTFENYISGQSVSVIGQRLGLPHVRLIEGIYIVYPDSKPDMHDFELAGVTYDPTDKFVTYVSGTPVYHSKKFQSKELYTKNAVIPVDFEKIKKDYQKVFNPDGLVKVIPVIKHFENCNYPQGGITPQFLAIRHLTWVVKYFIPFDGVFQK